MKLPYVFLPKQTRLPFVFIPFYSLTLYASASSARKAAEYVDCGLGCWDVLTAAEEARKVNLEMLKYPGEFREAMRVFECTVIAKELGTNGQQ